MMGYALRLSPVTLIPFLNVLLLVFIGCKGEDAPSRVTPAGAEKDTKTKTLEIGAAVLQSKETLDQFNTYMDGFHFMNGDINSQMEAHHFCSQINEDMHQCALFDGNGKNAPLIGIEYIVSAKLFGSLPSEEKALWHSHVYEVKSGQLIGPGLPDLAEHEFMEKLINTYGKTWHTWDTEKANIPTGIPMLMMGFTAEGQIKSELLAQRDKKLQIKTEQKKQQREDIPTPSIDPGADAWQKGNVVQLELKTQKK